MNKNLLLLLAAGGAFWYVRSKQSTPTGTNPVASSTGALHYQPSSAPTTSSAPTPGGSWLNTAAGSVAATSSLVKSGLSIWDSLSSAFGHRDTAGDTAGDRAGDTAGIWAGPDYSIIS